MTMVDLYLRLSDGRDLSSLEARKRKLQREADRRSWTVHRVVVENDVDVKGKRNASAYKTKNITGPDGRTVKRVVRKGFDSILDDLWDGQVHAMLAEDLDRIARNPADGQRVLDVAMARRATIGSLSGSGELTEGGTDDQQYNFQQKVLQAWKSSKDTSRRVREARENQADEGIWHGGPRPYGFTPVPHPEGKYQNTRLVVEPAEAKEIQSWADDILRDVSMRSVVASTNERGVPTTTGKGRWTGRVIKDILMRPVTAGIAVYQGKHIGRIDGEPILQEDVWRAVIGKLNSPTVSYVDRKGSKRVMARANNPGRPPKWLGTGIYLCPCGSVVDVGPRESYRCRSLRNGPGGGGHVRRNAAEVDKYVAGEIVERLADRDAFDLYAKSKAPGVDVDALRTEMQACLGRIGEYNIDRDEGRITRADQVAGIDRMNAKLAELQRQLDGATKVSAVGRLVSPFNPANDTAVEWVKLSIGEQRAIVAEMAVVTILPIGTPTGETSDDPIAQSYLDGSTVRQVAAQYKMTLREARAHLVEAGVKLRYQHVFREDLVRIEWK